MKKCRPIFFILFFLGLFSCSPFTSPNDKSEIEALKFTKPDGSQLDARFWRKGKSLIYFGFSHCPDMCPLALNTFGRTALILGPKSNDYRFIFVTLDAERDSPSLLANYVKQFPANRLIALSPSNQSLVELEKIFHILRKKVKDRDSYTIDHSNFIYLLDGNLNQIAIYPGGISAVTLANELRNISP